MEQRPSSAQELLRQQDAFFIRQVFTLPHKTTATMHFFKVVYNLFATAEKMHARYKKVAGHLNLHLPNSACKPLQNHELPAEVAQSMAIKGQSVINLDNILSIQHNEQYMGGCSQASWHELIINKKHNIQLPITVKPPFVIYKRQLFFHADGYMSFDLGKVYR